MLTLNSNFTEEFSKAEVEAILVVQIYTAVGTNFAFCTGSEGFTFDTIQDAFNLSASLAPKEVLPLVAACTPINMAMDPYDRTVIKNTVTITLANHPYIRAFVKNNRLHARAVTVKLGTRNLTNEVHWASVFAGCIESVSARDDGIDLECQDFYRWRGESLTNMWTNKHPLEVIKQLLLAQGVPESYIDDDMFDPTHADYADTIGHYCITHSGHSSGGIHGPHWVQVGSGPGHWRVDMALYDHILPWSTTIQFEQLIQDFVKMLVACLYFDESGNIRFVRFDTERAAVADWTDDDIRDIEQTQTIIVNQIEMSVTGERPDYGEPYKGGVTVKDSTSQTNHAYPGESVGVFTRSDDFPGINWHGDLQTEVGTTGALTPMRVYAPLGLSGCRVPDESYAYPWETMQHGSAAISASKPLYVLVNDEVMKCISLDLVEHEKLIIPDFQLGEPGVSHKPMYADLTILLANRGALNTTAVVHEDPWEEGTDPLEPMAKVFDITMHQAYAATQLQRFSNGCEIIELTTNLSEWAIQIGDFVTVTNSSFLAYGFDGVDSGHKWEVIEKEISLDDSTAHIKWTLAYATETSPPTIVGVYGWPDILELGTMIDLIPGLQYANESEVGVSRHTVMGLGATTSGLGVTIGPGAAGGGNKVVPYKASDTVTVEANKDHYFSLDLHTSMISIQTVATGAAQPALGRFSVPVAKAVAGGSTCTLTDLREFGAVRPRNMSTTDFEQGANLIPNPDFETWSRGPSYPPDHWNLLYPDTQDWIDDFTREETTTYSGAYALNMALTWGYMVSSIFRVEQGRVYQFGISLKASGTGVQQIISIQWQDAAKAQVSIPILVNHNASAGTTDMTRYDVSTTAPDTAVYARIFLSKFGTTPGNGIYDALRLVRSMPSFLVTNTTQTLPDGANTVLDFDIEGHDYGSNFDVTLGQNKFTAPFDGVYDFSAQLLGSKITNAHIDSYIYLAKNGTELIRGSKASLVRAKPSSFLVTNTTQSLTKSPATTMIDFDIEAHDSGGDFDVTAGENKFTAPVAGTYIFSVQILASSLTNGHANSYIFLAKNGSEVIRGAKGYNTAAGVYDFKIESVVLELAATDEIQVKYVNGHADDSELTGSTTANFFSGGLMQETISDNYDYKVESGPIQLDAADYIQVVYHNGHASDSVLTGSTTQNFFSGRQLS